MMMVVVMRMIIAVIVGRCRAMLANLRRLIVMAMRVPMAAASAVLLILFAVIMAMRFRLQSQRGFGLA
ncbi:hypothetical protein [Chromobacterium alticapitis]|uniref:hypothetical protein n=1 Tax=Chromobacterium alticapitis TaxID=2073169 RepID=UPI001E54CFD7|nr:hypothetical protein [Chromobacterium alticapitis]